LTTAQNALAAAKLVYDAVRVTWDATLLAEKEEMRGQAVDRFNDT